MDWPTTCPLKGCRVELLEGRWLESDTKATWICYCPPCDAAFLFRANQLWVWRRSGDELVFAGNKSWLESIRWRWTDLEGRMRTMVKQYLEWRAHPSVACLEDGSAIDEDKRFSVEGDPPLYFSWCTDCQEGFVQTPDLPYRWATIAHFGIEGENRTLRVIEVCRQGMDVGRINAILAQANFPGVVTAPRHRRR